MDSKMQQAHDWLQDPEALHGGVGEKSVRQVLLYRLYDHDCLINLVYKYNTFIIHVIISLDLGAGA